MDLGEFKVVLVSITGEDAGGSYEVNIKFFIPGRLGTNWLRLRLILQSLSLIKSLTGLGTLKLLLTKRAFLPHSVMSQLRG